MAIQVGGTQVISNSQGLTNIASVDTTTKNAIEAAGVGGSPIPDWGNSIYFNLQQASGQTSSTAATNVSYASNYCTITGAGNGTFIRLGMGSGSTSYARTFYIKHSSGNNWHRSMTTPWALTRNTTTDLTQGTYGGLREYHVFVASGANVRLRTSTFNLVTFTGYKVDL